MLMTLPTLQDLWKAACSARLHAYCPYSGYQVGAALRVKGSDRIFSGCNVENASYGASICAERNAVFQAVAALSGTPEVRDIVLVTRDPAPPCGMCLQVINEFSKVDTGIHLSTPERLGNQHTLQEFLPRPFSPESL